MLGLDRFFDWGTSENDQLAACKSREAEHSVPREGENHPIGEESATAIPCVRIDSGGSQLLFPVYMLTEGGVVVSDLSRPVNTRINTTSGGDADFISQGAIIEQIGNLHIAKQIEMSSVDEDAISTREKPQRHRHLRWFSHGKKWTALAFGFALCGSVCAVLSRRSTAFVRLLRPLEIAPIYLPVDNIGMLRMKLCHNATMNDGVSGCQVIGLSSDDIDDRMFEISRVLLTFATSLGVVLTVFVLSSAYWQSINLKPVSFGFVVTYFLQSFSMIFFDTKLCEDGNCRVGPGCTYCIVACFCWIITCIATARMDASKSKDQRQRKRLARKERAKSETSSEPPTNEVIVTKESTDCKVKGSLSMTRDTSTSTNSTFMMSEFSGENDNASELDLYSV